MQPQADTTHPLPAQRAFLVQVHAEAEVAQGRLAGRAEHVLSGQATHFASPEELLAFMARVLTPVPRPMPSPRALPQYRSGRGHAAPGHWPQRDVLPAVWRGSEGGRR